VPQSPPMPPCPPHDPSATVPQLPPEVAGDAGNGESPVVAAPPKVVPPPPPLPPPDKADDPATDDVHSWWSSEGRLQSSAWLVSFTVHAIVLFLLGLITLGVHSAVPVMNLLESAFDSGPASGDVDPQPTVIGSDALQAEPPTGPIGAVSNAEPLDVPIDSPKINLPIDKPGKFSDDRPATPGPAERPGGKAKPGGLAKSANVPIGGGWEGRDRAARSRLAGSGGGTRQSEAAVERGLQWLVAHQREDGSWCFDLTNASCKGMCRNSGSEPSTTAATGLALLPFLGAGYTHLKGEHREAVKKGIYYLNTRAHVTPHGIELCDGGSMYCHGIATLAVCEAYGMTKDESLRDIAQGAIRYIVYAQDLRGGGWRYSPGMPGDTTVSGWQLMALKSGQMAGLEILSPTPSRFEKFLNSVQFDKGSQYGYMTPQPRGAATTSVGLLCRMYMGWHRDRPALYRGVAHLHKWGPSETNMYYDFYATQVLHHWEGPEWQEWNKKMRDYLVRTQAAESHENGSWYFPDLYGDRGGRLYNTAMALMILEVYYRHMPLYGQKAIHDQL
jgi:hypothetical protein